MAQFSILSKLDSFIDSESFWSRIQKNMSSYPVYVTNSSLKNVYPFESDRKATRTGENICLRTSRRFYLFWTETHLYVRLFCERVSTFAWYFTHISIIIDHTMNFTDVWSLTIDYSHWYIPIAVGLLFDNFFICSAVFRIQIKGLVDKILRDWTYLSTFVKSVHKVLLRNPNSKIFIDRHQSPILWHRNTWFCGG